MKSIKILNYPSKWINYIRAHEIYSSNIFRSQLPIVGIVTFKNYAKL